MKIKTILVPTDFSETANHAVEQALEVAIATGATMHLFHVVEPRADEPGVVSALSDYVARLEKDAETSLALKVDVLRGNGVDVFYETARHVSPLDAISDATERLEPDLLVMGTHGRSGLGRLVLGSVTEKVLRHVPSNVLTLRKKAPVVRAAHAFERVLVPVDFSEFSSRAVRMAASLLVPGGELHVAHVVASPIHPSFYAGGITRLFELDPEMPKRIRDQLVDWLEGQDVQEITVREGDIFSELMDVAASAKAQLVVMGTRGLTGLDHLLMGSVSEKMVRVSGVPVLTVR